MNQFQQTKRRRGRTLEISAQGIKHLQDTLLFLTKLWILTAKCVHDHT